MAWLPRTFYLIAAALSLLGAVGHELRGAPVMLGPIETSGFPPDVVWMHYFNWHVGTVAVLAMMIMFLLAARRREHVAHTMIASAMSAGFAAIGMSLAIFRDPALWTTPAPYAWGPITILGILGVLLRSKPAQPMNNHLPIKIFASGGY